MKNLAQEPLNFNARQLFHPWRKRGTRRRDDPKGQGRNLGKKSYRLSLLLLFTKKVDNTWKLPFFIWYCRVWNKIILKHFPAWCWQFERNSRQSRQVLLRCLEKDERDKRIMEKLNCFLIFPCALSRQKVLSALPLLLCLTTCRNVLHEFLAT